jgi:hypothetical protein
LDPDVDVGVELMLVSEVLEIVEPPELEIVVLELVEDVSGAGVEPACVGPTAGKARSSVLIRIESNEVVPRWAKRPKPPSTRRPLNAKLATNAPFKEMLIVRPLIVSLSA